MNTDIFYASIEVFSLVICVCYPSWRSYKVVEAKKFDNEMLLWLSFWLIHAFVTKAEDVLTAVGACVCGADLLGGYTYRLVRILFFVWLIHPSYQGALFVYSNYFFNWYRAYHKPLLAETLKLLNVLFANIAAAHKQVALYNGNKLPTTATSAKKERESGELVNEVLNME